MSIFLSLLAITTGIVGVFTHQWITFFPRLGVSYLYNIRWVNWGFRVTTVVLALGAYAIDPTSRQIIMLGITLLLTTVTGFTRANRVTPAPLSKLPVSRQRWLGWQEFHPSSGVYNKS